MNGGISVSAWLDASVQYCLYSTWNRYIELLWRHSSTQHVGQGEGQGAVREYAAVTPSRNAVSYKSHV